MNRRGFLGGLIAALFAPAVPRLPAPKPVSAIDGVDGGTYTPAGEISIGERTPVLSIDWSAYEPPIHHNCRCKLVPL